MFKASEEAARVRNEQKAEISKQNIENLNCLGEIFEAIPDVPEDKAENVEKARDNVNKAIENLDSEALKEAMIELGNNILLSALQTVIKRSSIISTIAEKILRHISKTHLPYRSPGTAPPVWRLYGGCMRSREQESLIITN